MAEFWLDPSAPTHGSGTFASPFRDLTQAGGSDIINIKRGTTHRQNIEVTASGSDAAPLLFRAYGDPWLPKPLLYPTTGDSCISGNDRRNVHIEDLQFSIQSGASLAVYLIGANPTACQNLRVSRCNFFNLGRPGIAQAGGVVIHTYVIGAGPVSNVLVEDVTVDGCNSMGLSVYGNVNGVLARRNRFSDCAKVFAGHGASHFASRADIPFAALTLMSGTIYRAVFGAAQAEASGFFGTPQVMYRVIKRGGTSLFEATNAGATTTPGVGQCSLTGGFLYVNFGEAIGPDDVLTAHYEEAKNIIHEDSVFERTRNTNGVEGAGLQFDDGAEGIARRCISRNNDGYGLVSNLGANCIFESNIVENNATGGILTSIGSGSRADGNTVIGNGPYGIRMWYPASAQRVRNNIIVGHDVAIRGHSGVRGGNNLLWRNGAEYADGIGSQMGPNFFGDPLLTRDRAPLRGSPAVRAGTPEAPRSRDFHGVLRHPLLPTIGAFEPAIQTRR